LYENPTEKDPLKQRFREEDIELALAYPDTAMLAHMLINGVSNQYGNQKLTTMDSPFTGHNYYIDDHHKKQLGQTEGPRGFLEW